MSPREFNYIQEGHYILKVLPIEGKIGASILALNKAADTYRASGRYDEAINCCTKALSLAQDPDLDIPSDLDVKYAKGFTQMHLGTVYFGQKKLEEAVVRYHQAQKLFNEQNKPYSEAIAWMALGIVYYVRAQDNPKTIGSSDDDWKRSMKAYQRSYDIFRKLDNPILMDEIKRRLAIVKHEYQRAMEDFCREETARKKQWEKPREEEVEGITGSFTLPSEEGVLKIPVIAIPIVAKIAAGIEFTLAQENITGYLVLDKESARNATFALRVKGNSMINAHILNGDYVLIYVQEEVEDGEIAAVRITEEEEATLKRFYKGKIDGEIYWTLKPENDQEPTIIVSSKEFKPKLKERLHEKFKRLGRKVEFRVGIPTIEGKVVGVIRTFREMQSSP